jgi:EAL domain-containing protein (putative c-di-GMP-specific phosphodiesterase class I)
MEPKPRNLIDQVTDLPTVPLLLQRMRRQLVTHGYLSVLSINVMQSGQVERVTGWKAFDGIVRDVGRFLSSIKTVALRRDDFVSEVMISGNAFVVLLAPPRRSQAIDMADLLSVRDRLAAKLRGFLAQRLPEDISESFCCFVGASMVRNEPGMRLERLVYRALDEAQADSLEERRRAAQRHIIDLRDVLEARLVRSVYQPIVNILKPSVLGWEALSRPAGGSFENIEELFKAAYEARSIWPLERLCREKAMEGLSGLGSGELLFLNVEPDSIDDPQFRSPQMIEMIEEAGLSPDRVVLEMTEHARVRDFTAFRQTLTYFRSLGFRLAIDDMGSGYSALASVAEIQPEFIKIDMSLVHEVDTRPLKRELVDTIARFARRAGIGVIAEGIETMGELEVLLDIGVPLGQGFLFARPSAPPPQPDLDMLREPRLPSRPRQQPGPGILE